jgi:hypothetical protein
VYAARRAFQFSSTAIAVPSTMHIAIEVAQAPTGSVITLLASPNGSPTRSSTPAARTIPVQISAATLATTVAPRLASSSRPYGARVAVRGAWVRLGSVPSTPAGLRQTVRMRLHLVVASAALALTAPLLAACGSNESSSSSSGSYCDELKADKSYFEGISGSSNSDLSSLDQVFQRMHTLAADAPDSVSADWKTLDGAITTMQNALKDAGLKPSDLASLQSGKVPPGVDPSKLASLAPKLQELSSSDVSTAAKNIAADAKKNCNVDLSGN